MALPTGLFVDAPEMQDPSLTQVSAEVDEWPEEVVSKLKERIPQANGLNIIVKFMKQDEENGAATGSAVVGDAKKQVIVPVIIKDFMLYPIDVMIADKKLLPLTPDYFNAVFSGTAAFQKLEEYPTFGGLGRFEDANLWNATYPPSLGRYAYASAGFNIMDQISDTLSENDIAEFKKMASDPAIMSNFYKHGHADLVKKVANLRPVNMNEFRQGADNLIKKDIFMLRKDGPNKYSILSNAASVFSPSLVTMPKEDLYGFMTTISDKVQDDINDVDQNGEKMIITYKPDAQFGEPYIDGTISPKIEMAHEFDHYIVKDKAGVEFEGMVVPTVINFDMERTPLKLFLGKTMSTVQNDFAGVRVENSRWQLEGQDFRVGQTGTFFWRPKGNHSKCLATVPVTIKSIAEGIDGCRYLLKVVDLQGRTFKIKFNYDGHLERIAPMGEDTYLMPNGFHWYPMEGFKEVSSSLPDYGAKIAAVTKTANPVTLISTGYGQYALKGAEKYASAMGWDPSNLHGYQAKFLLASLGASQEKIAQFTKQASRSGKAVIHGLHYVPTKNEKIARALPKAQKLHKIAADMRCNLIKEASFIENSQTVDALLSLNFVNPENISKFVGKMGQLKSAISTLASMIVASRLGIKEIPEQAASTAMYRLIDVVNGLEALRATQEAR